METASSRKGWLDIVRNMRTIVRILRTEGFSAFRDDEVDSPENPQIVGEEMRLSDSMDQDSPDVDWEDLERSALDSDEGVRHEALARLMVIDHDEDTIEWYLWLLAEVIERYADGQAGIALTWLSTRSEEWFGMTWKTADKLLELNNPDVTMLLTVGYFEVVLREGRGLDDPRIQAWIEGDDIRKKRVLLEVADWLGLDAGRLWEIVAPMANDKDNEVAERARKMLGTDQT